MRLTATPSLPCVLLDPGNPSTGIRAKTAGIRGRPNDHHRHRGKVRKRAQSSKGRRRSLERKEIDSVVGLTFLKLGGMTAPPTIPRGALLRLTGGGGEGYIYIERERETKGRSKTYNGNPGSNTQPIETLHSGDRTIRHRERQHDGLAPPTRQTHRRWGDRRRGRR